MGIIAAKKNRASGRIAETRVNMKIRPGEQEEQVKPSEFVCTCCGKPYKKQKGIFPVSRSPLFKGWGGYFPVCRTCLKKYWEGLVEFYGGDEKQAMERFAQLADWYFLDDTFEEASDDCTVNPNHFLLFAYSGRVFRTGVTKYGTSYLDTVRDRAEGIITNEAQALISQQAEAINGTRKATDEQLKQWGLGYSPEELYALDDHYELLKTKIEHDDVVQEELIRELCSIRILQSRALKSNDTDTYVKLSNSYQSTLKNANLIQGKQAGATSSESDDCWGTTVQKIESFCPAEIYKDQNVFDDVDGIREYFTRFILRPVRNFFLGTNEMDKEFVIKSSEDDNQDSDSEEDASVVNTVIDGTDGDTK